MIDFIDIMERENNIKISFIDFSNIETDLESMLLLEGYLKYSNYNIWKFFCKYSEITSLVITSINYLANQNFRYPFFSKQSKNVKKIIFIFIIFYFYNFLFHFFIFYFHFLFLFVFFYFLFLFFIFIFYFFTFIFVFFIFIFTFTFVFVFLAFEVETRNSPILS